MLGSFYTITYKFITGTALRAALPTAMATLLLSCLCAPLVSCNYNIAKKSSAGDGGQSKTDIGTMLGQDVIFNPAQGAQSFVLGVCLHCHDTGGKGNPTLNSIAAIKANLHDVVLDIDQDDMPKPDLGDKPLSACQKAVLHAWIDQGEPETSTIKISTLPACANLASSPTGSPVPVPVPGPVPVATPVPPPVATPAPVPPGVPQFVGDHVIQKVVLGVCLHCHDAGGKQPQLNSIALIKSNIKNIVADVTADDMPSPRKGDKPLSACQKAILNKWVELQTPRTSTVSVASLPECAVARAILELPVAAPLQPGIRAIGDEQVNYQTFLARVLTPKCLKCHSVDSTSKAKDILFFPYSAITSRARLFAPPGASSRFVRLVTRTDNGRMPPLDDGEGLDQDQVAFVIKWIDAGTPEN
jgi:cytochrome c553